MSITSNIRYSTIAQKNQIVSNMTDLASTSDFKLEVEDISMPWVASESKLANFVLKEIKIFDDKASLVLYHSNTECSVIKEKYPDIDSCAFGAPVSNLFQDNESFRKKDVASFMKVLIATVRKVH